MSNAAINFGQAWSTPLGQDLSMPAVMQSGVMVVIESILRRWTTPAGTLVDDPDYGYSLIDHVSDDMSPSDISKAQQQLGAEALKDERVQRCTVTLALTAAGVLTVAASGLTAAGPFKFVFGVQNATIQNLKVSP